MLSRGHRIFVTRDSLQHSNRMGASDERYPCFPAAQVFALISAAITTFASTPIILADFGHAGIQ